MAIKCVWNCLLFYYRIIFNIFASVGCTSYICTNICIYLHENVSTKLAIGKKRYNIFWQLLPHQTLHSEWRKTIFFCCCDIAIPLWHHNDHHVSIATNKHHCSDCEPFTYCIPWRWPDYRSFTSYIYQNILVYKNETRKKVINLH